MLRKLAVVIPTLGRYAELRRLLVSLALQSRLPQQLLIVGEGEGNAEIAEEFQELSAEFIFFPGSSICDARNRGAHAARPDIDLIAFIDDDIVLDPGAIAAVMRFWETAPEDLGGTGLNVLNDSPRAASWLKKKRIAARLGLYDSTKGAVARSGFHVPFGEVSESIGVAWLPTYCVVYARQVFERYGFDEFFKGYSYLEDLDLSYQIGKKYRLAVIPDARFYHFPSIIGRPNSYLFGKKEVVNRLYFVSKHPELSRRLCFLGLCVRSLMSVCQGLFRLNWTSLKRAAGNLAALALTARSGLRPV